MALEILLTLVEKVALPFVDAAWINELLKRAAAGDMDDDTFAFFLRLSARREEKDVAIPSGRGYAYAQRRSVPPETATSEYTLFTKVSQNVKTCSEQEGGWQDDAVYGGLLAMRDIPQLGFFYPGRDFFGILFRAMEKSKSFRVRKAAYDVVVAARDGWLRSARLRQTLKDLDFPRQLRGVAIETNRSDLRRSFLTMTEILSEDGDWHSYLREIMDLWLHLRHEGPDQVLRILTRVGGLSPAECDYSSPLILDEFLGKFVEGEWARVPGRPVEDLTAGRLEPLVGVTKRLKELLFIDDERRAILAVVEQVIQFLERRGDGGYEGPGEDTRRIVNDLLETLRMPGGAGSY